MSSKGVGHRISTTDGFLAARQEPSRPLTILADHLSSLVEDMPEGGRTIGLWAFRILADPQDHIDALVDAGVLKSVHMIGGSTRRFLLDDGTESAQDAAAYVVVTPEPPHVHDWRVTQSGHVNIWLTCEDCGEQKEVRNRLPIELPEVS